MRGSKAKELRRMAEKFSVGMPSRRLLVKPTLSITRGGKIYNRQSSMAINHPQSTRGIYRALKRNGGSLPAADIAKEKEHV